MPKYGFLLTNPNDVVDSVYFTVEVAGNYNATDQWARDFYDVLADPANFLPGVTWTSADKDAYIHVSEERHDITVTP